MLNKWELYQEVVNVLHETDIIKANEAEDPSSISTTANKGPSQNREHYVILGQVFNCLTTQSKVGWRRFCTLILDKQIQTGIKCGSVFRIYPSLQCLLFSMDILLVEGWDRGENGVHCLQEHGELVLN